jgi:hypothetical protein
MDVAPIMLDEMERWNLVQDGKDYGADSGERQEETYRGYEEASARAIGDAFVDSLGQGRALRYEQQESCYYDCEQEYEPGVGHRVLEHFQGRHTAARRGQQVPYSRFARVRNDKFFELPASHLRPPRYAFWASRFRARSRV